MRAEELPTLACPLMSEIRDAICRKYRVSMTELLSEQRGRHIVRPRQIGMYLARKMTLRSLPEIGRHFGNRDHATVMHATRRVEQLCAEDEEIAGDVLLLEIALRSAAHNRHRTMWAAL